MSKIIASTYEIIGKLGSGGGGIVYLANHIRLGKKVVLKADKRNINTQSVFLRREVDVLKELRHTYIPQVYDYFIENNIAYTVMDFVDGESLDKLIIREKRFPQPTVIYWAKQLLEALSYLHSPTHGDPPRGYIHSDIKPANIMLRPNGDICLIDFNISLAIGIENVVGKSAGYSSPEHYGLDYSSGFQSVDSTTVRKNNKSTAYDDKKTILLEDESTLYTDEKTELLELEEKSNLSSRVKKIIVPDARSDIYSVGATLYHLLSGNRPANAINGAVPLSDEEFSPMLVAIITKAMDLNPDMRFNTADEMLQAFNDLWKNDPRIKRQKKIHITAGLLLSIMFMAGTAASFIGIKQMERIQTAQVLAASSSEALSRGDVSGALNLALDALVDEPGIFDIPYTPEAQLALTNALGVYDLSDSFKPCRTIELPSAPFKMVRSPDETILAVCYARELALYKLDSGKCIKTLQTFDSAMCDVRFISDTRIIYAGNEGLSVYDIQSDSILWQGEPAASIALSEDGAVAAAVRGTDEIINFYDTETGERISFRDLNGRHLNIPENDKFADSQKHIFTLNSDGSMCAVSLNGGYLEILDIYNSENDLIIYEGSDFTAFNGCFNGDIFAFSAAGASGSLLGLVDWKNAAYLGDMAGNSIFHVMTYNGELYVTQNDTAVRIDTDTLEQTEIAYTENKNITAFDISENYAVSASDDGYSVFFRGAGILQSNTRSTAPKFVIVTDSYIALADRNSPVIELLKFAGHEDQRMLEYDPEILHSEAAILSDKSGVMLFDTVSFTVVNSDGSIRTAAEIPEPEKIYDQQYRKDGDHLEVTYYSGKTVCYSADTGEIISESEAAPPDDSLDEEFETEKYIISSPLHGTPTVYSKETGEKLTELSSNDYLTYITETGEYIVARYVSADGSFYGILMNGKCEPVAILPRLCDVYDGTLIFDLPNGNIKTSQIYGLNELKEKAKNHRD